MSTSMDTAALTRPGGSRSGTLAKMLAGFVAGAAAYLIFHQGAVYLGGQLGLIAATPYPGSPAAVTGLPQYASTAFWAGLWGIAFAFAQSAFPRGAGYWVLSILFGAILPTLIALTLVAYLKDLPLLAGGDLQRIATALVLNGIWGLGAGLILRAFIRR